MFYLNIWLKWELFKLRASNVFMWRGDFYNDKVKHKNEYRTFAGHQFLFKTLCSLLEKWRMIHAEFTFPPNASNAANTLEMVCAYINT